jgi:hypothetical protein
MENKNTEEKGNGQNYPFEDSEYMGNIFGRKYTLYALIIILLFIGIAVCRYLVIQPEQLIEDPDNPAGFNYLDEREIEKDNDLLRIYSDKGLFEHQPLPKFTCSFRGIV